MCRRAKEGSIKLKTLFNKKKRCMAQCHDFYTVPSSPPWGSSVPGTPVYMVNHITLALWWSPPIHKQGGVVDILPALCVVSQKEGVRVNSTPRPAPPPPPVRKQAVRRREGEGSATQTEGPGSPSGRSGIAGEHSLASWLALCSPHPRYQTHWIEQPVERTDCWSFPLFTTFSPLLASCSVTRPDHL